MAVNSYWWEYLKCNAVIIAGSACGNHLDVKESFVVAPLLKCSLVQALVVQICLFMWENFCLSFCTKKACFVLLLAFKRDSSKAELNSIKAIPEKTCSC